MDFEEQNDLYVVGEWDEGRSGLSTHEVVMVEVARGSVRQKGRFPLELSRPFLFHISVNDPKM